jgi:hypothetical protein
VIITQRPLTIGAVKLFRRMYPLDFPIDLVRTKREAEVLLDGGDIYAFS